MQTKKKNSLFGRYPCCDIVNNAIRAILNGDTNTAIEDLYQAICKADGYLYDDLTERVTEIHNRVWNERQQIR